MKNIERLVNEKIDLRNLDYNLKYIIHPCPKYPMGAGKYEIYYILANDEKTDDEADGLVMGHVDRDINDPTNPILLWFMEEAK